MKKRKTMRTNHTTIKKTTIQQSLPYWIETNHKVFFKLFKKRIVKYFDYDKAWGIYFQSYGLFFKTIQSILSEYDKDMIVTSVFLDKKLEKQIKKITKQIKNGKNGS